MFFFLVTCLPSEYFNMPFFKCVMYVIVAGWEWPIMRERVTACVQQPLIGLGFCQLFANEKVGRRRPSEVYNPKENYDIKQILTYNSNSVIANFESIFRAKKSQNPPNFIYKKCHNFKNTEPSS